MGDETECDNRKAAYQLKVESRLPADLIGWMHRDKTVEILRFGANAAMLQSKTRNNLIKQFLGWCRAESSHENEGVFVVEF